MSDKPRILIVGPGAALNWRLRGENGSDKGPVPRYIELAKLYDFVVPSTGEGDDTYDSAPTILSKSSDTNLATFAKLLAPELETVECVLAGSRGGHHTIPALWKTKEFKESPVPCFVLNGMCCLNSAVKSLPENLRLFVAIAGQDRLTNRPDGIHPATGEPHEKGIAGAIMKVLRTGSDGNVFIYWNENDEHLLYSLDKHELLKRLMDSFIKGKSFRGIPDGGMVLVRDSSAPTGFKQINPMHGGSKRKSRKSRSKKRRSSRHR